MGQYSPLSPYFGPMRSVCTFWSRRSSQQRQQRLWVCFCALLGRTSPDRSSSSPYEYIRDCCAHPSYLRPAWSPGGDFAKYLDAKISCFYMGRGGAGATALAALGLALHGAGACAAVNAVCDRMRALAVVCVVSRHGESKGSEKQDIRVCM